MSDVYQTGAFATLHRLKSDNLLQMERDLKTFSSARPIALVLPALYSEFARRLDVADPRRTDQGPLPERDRRQSRTGR